MISEARKLIGDSKVYSVSGAGYAETELNQSVPYLETLLDPFMRKGYIPDTSLQPRVLKDQRYSSTRSGQTSYLFVINGHNKRTQISVYAPFTPVANYPMEWVWVADIDPDEKLSDQYSDDRPVSFGVDIRSSTQSTSLLVIQGTIDAVYTRFFPKITRISSTNLSTYRQDACNVMTGSLVGAGITVTFDAAEDLRMTPSDTNAVQTVTDAVYDFQWTVNINPGDVVSRVPTQKEWRTIINDPIFFQTDIDGNLAYPLKGRTYFDFFGSWSFAYEGNIPSATTPEVELVVFTQDAKETHYRIPSNWLAQVGVPPPPKKPRFFETDSDFEEKDVKHVRSDVRTEVKKKELKADPIAPNTTWSAHNSFYIDTNVPIVGFYLAFANIDPVILSLLAPGYMPDFFKVKVGIKNYDVFATGYNSPTAVVILSGIDEKQQIVVKGVRWSEATPNTELIRNLKISYPRGLNVTDMDYVRDALNAYGEQGYGRIWTSEDFKQFQRSDMINKLSNRSTMIGAALDWRGGFRNAMSWLGKNFLKPALRAGLTSLGSTIPSLLSSVIQSSEDDLIKIGTSSDYKIEPNYIEEENESNGIPIKILLEDLQEILKNEELTEAERDEAILKKSNCVHLTVFLEGLSYEYIRKYRNSKLPFDFMKDALYCEAKRMFSNRCWHCDTTHFSREDCERTCACSFSSECPACTNSMRCSAKHRLCRKCKKDIRDTVGLIFGTMRALDRLVNVGLLSMEYISGLAMEEPEQGQPQQPVVPPATTLTKLNFDSYVEASVGGTTSWSSYLNPRFINTVLKSVATQERADALNGIPIRFQKFPMVIEGEGVLRTAVVSTKPFEFHYTEDKERGVLRRSGVRVEYTYTPEAPNIYVDRSYIQSADLIRRLAKDLGFTLVFVTLLEPITGVLQNSNTLAVYAAMLGLPSLAVLSGSIKYGDNGLDLYPVGGVTAKLQAALTANLKIVGYFPPAEVEAIMGHPGYYSQRDLDMMVPMDRKAVFNLKDVSSVFLACLRMNFTVSEEVKMDEKEKAAFLEQNLDKMAPDAKVHAMAFLKAKDKTIPNGFIINLKSYLRAKEGAQSGVLTKSQKIRKKQKERKERQAKGVKGEVKTMKKEVLTGNFDYFYRGRKHTASRETLDKMLNESTLDLNDKWFDNETNPLKTKAAAIMVELINKEPDIFFKYSGVERPSMREQEKMERMRVKRAKAKPKKEPTEVKESKQKQEGKKPETTVVTADIDEM